jgi:mannose-6-phosphate isomerase-like protein (cupin superfamily)
MSAADEILILDAGEGPELEIVEGDGRAIAIVWPGMGAELRSIHKLELGAGARTIGLRHPSEAVYYVVLGTGEAADGDTGERQALGEGAMVHIEPGTGYVLSAGPGGMTAFGGPAPPDPAIYERTR